MKSWWMPLLVGALLLGGCGESQQVGSERLLEFEEQEGGRLGQATPTPEPGTPAPVALGEQPTPTPQPTPQPTPEEVFFDVVLVSGSPYYEPGNDIRISTGTTIRVTNKDTTPERSEGRSFTARNGAFDSGMLRPGETWTWRFSSPGGYEVVDRGLTFASARLTVR